MQATLTKTSQTKQIAGFPCTVHDLQRGNAVQPHGSGAARAWT